MRPVHGDAVEAEDVSVTRDHLVSLHRVASPDDQLGGGAAESVPQPRPRGPEAGVERPGGDVIRMEGGGFWNELMRVFMALHKGLYNIYLSDESV